MYIYYIYMYLFKSFEINLTIKTCVIKFICTTIFECNITVTYVYNLYILRHVES